MEIVQPGGGGGGVALEVSDGTHNVMNVSEILFTGATVSSGGGGTADVLISASATSITVGTTTVASGTDKYILYDNAGTLGNLQPTGTGLVVLQTSPTLITPTIGVATATSINGNTFTTGTYTLTGTAGKTLTFSNSITLAGTDSTTMTFPSTSATIARTDAGQTFTGVRNTTSWSNTDAQVVVSTPTTTSEGYLGMPQNSQSAGYTTVLTDAGKHIYHPSADTTARAWVIAANSSVAYPIGTLLTFVNDVSAGVITLSITTDTMYNITLSSSGTRTMAAGSSLTALKVTSTRWVAQSSAGVT
jgi:hypothetical protein